MVFSLHDYILEGLKDAIGNLADYQIILNSVGWQEKGVLTDTDLAMLQDLINQKNTPIIEPEVLEPMEESTSSIPPLVRTIK